MAKPNFAMQRTRREPAYLFNGGAAARR
jgi:hypothetical protein